MSAIPRNRLETSFEAPNSAKISMLKAAVALMARRASSIVKFWSYRRTMTQLDTLDDYMLKDIGVTRGDIHVTASHLYSKDPTIRLRALGLERRASDRAWSKEIDKRRNGHAQNKTGPVCEPYRSSDQRSMKVR